MKKILLSLIFFSLLVISNKSFAQNGLSIEACGGFIHGPLGLESEITDWISSNKQNATNINVEGTEFVVGLDLAFHIYYTGR